MLSAAAAVLLATGQLGAESRLERIVPARAPRPDGVTAWPRAQAAGSTHRDSAATGPLSSRRARGLAAVLAGTSGGVLVGGGFGLLVAPLAAVGTWIGLGRLEPAALARRREQCAAQLPLALDLLSAALAAGCPPVHAVEHVGRALDDPLGRILVLAAAAARVGGDPARAWSSLEGDPVLRPLGRALRSATLRGISPTAALQRAAQDAREAARRTAETRARAVGTRAAAPLGLCFLPAFVLLGIVPVVATSGLPLP
ncbi:type II secretion system F family protein [Phytoactinopolyspora mesophila]|uniref:type II secretion system F family protein n=1 Tax=Phytoactinopolyspora mesophila TaxID=2650750 RepID=UPI00139098B2